MPTTHRGGCHCGAVRYRVELDLSRPATQCNCSICSRTGTLLSFVPAEAFTLGCLADVDATALEVQHFDGKSR